MTTAQAFKASAPSSGAGPSTTFVREGVKKKPIESVIMIMSVGGDHTLLGFFSLML